MTNFRNKLKKCLKFQTPFIKIFFIILFGAGGGGRTHTSFRTQDFKSCASAIPPHQHVASLALARFEHKCPKHRFDTRLLLFSKTPRSVLRFQCESFKGRLVAPLPQNTQGILGDPLKRVGDPRKSLSCSFSNLNISKKMTQNIILEVPPGFEPGNKGVADLCLTTWRWYHNVSNHLFGTV